MDGLLSLKTRLRRLLAPGQAAPTTVLAMPAAVARPEPEPEPGPFQGYLDAASNRHVAGWIRDLSKPGTRVAYRVIAVIDGVETVLHEGVADEHTAQLETIGVGDGSHAFYARFDRRLSDTERDSLAVQVVATGRAIELAPGIEREWNPIRYIALDVVDNCNLRCPFCLFDYTGVNRTNAMDPAAFASTLRLAPLTTLGNFWLSCLHEPTLHPQFEALLDGIPQEQRRKVFYTTNLAILLRTAGRERAAQPEHLHRVVRSCDLRADAQGRQAPDLQRQLGYHAGRVRPRQCAAEGALHHDGVSLEPGRTADTGAAAA